jgi:two-component system phosphate regulon sensor histidine kinase PhoR
VGIPPAHLGRLFERFYRVDAGRSREMGGTGLGLAIVKHLTQALHGSVRAASRLGHGTTFIVSFPQALQPGSTAQGVAESPPLLHQTHTIRP